MKAITAVATTALVLSGAATPGQGQEPPASPQPAPAGTTAQPDKLRNGCGRLYTQRQFRRSVRRAYKAASVSRNDKKHLRRMAQCQHSPKAERNAHLLLRRERRERQRIERMGVKGIAYMMLKKRGQLTQFSCLVALWTRESGWNVHAHNPSGAHGIPQALPGSKMGPGWESNPYVQIKWGISYTYARYGSPCAADSHQRSAGWY